MFVPAVVVQHFEAVFDRVVAAVDFKSPLDHRGLIPFDERSIKNLASRVEVEFREQRRHRQRLAVVAGRTSAA